MKKLTNEKLKQVELNLLIEIDKICREHGWRYSLGAGTLIGAIRHRGFIPWDDDIDIMMPRTDYDQLIAHINSHVYDFGVITCENNKYYQDIFAKVYDKNTIIVESVGNTDLTNLGVFVDIFPIEGLGENEKQAKHNAKKGKLLHLILTCAGMKKYSKSTNLSVLYEPIRFLVYCCTRNSNANRIANKLDCMYKKIDFDKSEYVGTTSGSFKERTVLKRKEYTEFCEVDFEGHKFLSIKAYDKYLKNCYGDYMVLPPEERRVSHHTFEAYWKD